MTGGLRQERNLRAGFAAIRVPAYRRYLVGATANSITVWLFQTAISWTILQQTGSAAAVGVLFLAWTFPTLFTMIPAGVLVDRIGPRRGMLISQGLSVIAFAGGAYLAATGQLTVEWALVLAVVVGALDGFWSSPSLVMAGRIVEPSLLPSAMGLSSLTFGAGRIIGGLLGGLLVAANGPTPALAMAAFGPLVAGLMTLTLPNVPGLERRRGSMRDFPDALNWMARVPAARALLLLGMAVATFGYSYVSLLPILTQDLLGAGATALGVVTAATGFGVIIGALVMEALGRAIGRGRTILLVLLLGSAAMAALGLSHLLPVSMVVAGTLACVLIIFRTTTIALLQALAPARMRGRVLAIFEVCFWGINPIGGLLGGLLADRVGAAEMFIVFGAALAISTVAAALLYRGLPSLDIESQGRVMIRGLVYVDGRVLPRSAEPAGSATAGFSPGHPALSESSPPEPG